MFRVTTHQVRSRNDPKSNVRLYPCAGSSLQCFSSLFNRARAGFTGHKCRPTLSMKSTLKKLYSQSLRCFLRVGGHLSRMSPNSINEIHTDNLYSQSLQCFLRVGGHLYPLLPFHPCKRESDRWPNALSVAFRPLTDKQTYRLTIPDQRQQTSNPPPSQTPGRHTACELTMLVIQMASKPQPTICEPTHPSLGHMHT